jgi:hypothetical protein
MGSPSKTPSSVSRSYSTRRHRRSTTEPCIMPVVRSSDGWLTEAMLSTVVGDRQAVNVSERIRAETLFR